MLLLIFITNIITKITTRVENSRDVCKIIVHASVLGNHPWSLKIEAHRIVNASIF